MPKKAGGSQVLGLDDEAIKAMPPAGGSSAPISEEELSAAFDFFDVDKAGKLKRRG